MAGEGPVLALRMDRGWKEEGGKRLGGGVRKRKMGQVNHVRGGMKVPEEEKRWREGGREG